MLTMYTMHVSMHMDYPGRAQKGVTPLFLHYCDYPNFYFIMTVVVVLMHKINIAIEAFDAIISSFCIYLYIQ